MALTILPIRRALIDHALGTGRFLAVSGHEPKSAPSAGGLTAAVWVQTVRPVAAMSGLDATSARVEFWLRIYQNAFKENQDDIDPTVDEARDVLMVAYSGNFTLGGLVQKVDLLGAHGEPLSARAGFLTQDQRVFRTMTITIPCVVLDAWTQDE